MSVRKVDFSPEQEALIDAAARELGVSFASMAKIICADALAAIGLKATAPLTPSQMRSVKGPGFVYLARNGELHKIGLSTNPLRRMDQIDAELIHAIEVPNMLAAERALHIWFQLARVTGEWFALSPADVDWFVGLTAQQIAEIPI